MPFLQEQQSLFLLDRVSYIYKSYHTILLCLIVNYITSANDIERTKYKI